MKTKRHSTNTFFMPERVRHCMMRRVHARTDWGKGHSEHLWWTVPS